MPSELRDLTRASGAVAGSSTVVAKRLQLARAGVLFLLALALICAYLTRHCLAVANTTMQLELGINNQQFGYLYGAFSAGYLLFQVPGGWLGQRWGTRITLPLLSLLWSCATIATAWVTTLPALVLARFAFGLAQGGLIPNQAKVVNDWFPAASRGATSSVIVMAMSIGSVASVGLTSRLMVYYDWRTVFEDYALVGVAWAVLFYVLFRTSPETVPWLREGTVRDSGDPSFGAAVETAPAPHWMRILTSRNVWGLAGQLFFKTAGYNLLVTFFPTLLEYAYGTKTRDAGELTSWSLVALVIGSLVGGRLVDQLHDRTGSKRISRCGVAIGALLLTAVLMAAASLATTDRQSAAMMAAAALFSGMALPCPWAAVVDIGGKNSALVMGYVNVGSCLAGIAVTPAVGRLIDYLRDSRGNWNLVIYVHAAFYLAAALCWLSVDPEITIDPLEPPHAV